VSGLCQLGLVRRMFYSMTKKAHPKQLCSLGFSSGHQEVKIMSTEPGLLVYFLRFWLGQFGLARHVF